MNDYTYSGREFDLESVSTNHEMTISRSEETPDGDISRRPRRQRRAAADSESLQETPDANDPFQNRRRQRRPADTESSDQPRQTPDRQSDIENSHQPKRPHRNPGELPAFIAKPLAFLRDRRTRSILGVALIILAGYLTIAAISYLSTNEADQSSVTSETLQELAQAPDHVENAAGAVGAKMTHHLFVEGLGVGSIVLIIYLFILGLALVGVKKIKFWALTFKSLLIAITASIVVGLLTLDSHTAVPLGGYHGQEINHLIIDYAHPLGAVMVSIFLVATVMIIYIAQLTSLYNSSREKIRAIQAKRELDNERRRQQEESMREALADGPINNPADQGETSEPDPDNPDFDDNASSSIITMPAVYESDNDRHTTTQLADFGLESDDRIDDEHDEADAPDKADEADEFGESDKEQSDPTPESAAEARNQQEQDQQNDDSDSPVTSNPIFAITKANEIEQADADTDHTDGTDGTDGTDANQAVQAMGEYDPRADLSRYRMPDVALFHERANSNSSIDVEEQEAHKNRITKVLNDYGIEITQIEAIVGPTVTLYKIVPAEGVRIAKIKRLEDEIAMSLAAKGIRIIAPIPGESNIGIEVPNLEPQVVSIRSILGSKAYKETNCQLPMALGATINNEVFIADLAKMPHLLVAGATGQGKSVCLNTIIASLIYKLHPSELKFVLVDPKMVEFSLYAQLEKHYLAKIPDIEEPIVTDPGKAVETLNSLCIEMDNRYNLLKNAQCRSLTEYNEKFRNRRLNPEKGHRYLPYIVMIVDEFADLIMMAGKSVEMPIARIAQKARAVGMHLIIATQRPSTNVITGMIKANFPGRIAFAVRQRVDSQTILDCPGANQLIGRGDMLISKGGPIERVQCAFIDTDEVEALCQFIDDQIGFPTAYILPDPPTEAAEGGGSGASLTDRDPLFEEIARMVSQSNTASTSNIQRKYSIGYNRAGKIMDQLEMAGIVGPASGGKPRQVLMSPEDVEMVLSTL